MRAFPILAVSAERLSPALGFMFDARWVHRHESLLSMLWKFSIMNPAPGHLLVAQLDVLVDPYRGIAPLRTKALCAAAGQLLGLSRHAIARGLLTEPAAKIATPHFRFCRRCAYKGFHSVLFQLPHVRTCPIHEIVLSERCVSCAKPITHEVSVLSLEHPYACSHCGKHFCPSLPKLLSQRQKRSAEHEARFENCFDEHAFPLLGYPGRREQKPFKPRPLPAHEVQALLDEMQRSEYFFDGRRIPKTAVRQFRAHFRRARTPSFRS